MKIAPVIIIIMLSSIVLPGTNSANIHNETAWYKQQAQLNVDLIIYRLKKQVKEADTVHKQ